MTCNPILAMMLSASLLLAGCSSDDDSGNPASSSPSTQSGTGGGGTGDGGTGPGTGSGTAGDGGSGDGTGGATDGGGSTGGGAGTDTGASRTWRGAAVVAPREGQLTNSRTRIDDAGNALTAWRTNEVDGRLYVSHYLAATNTWSPPHPLSATGIIYDFDIETAPNGRALAAWIEEVSLDRYMLYVSRYEAGGAWGPAEPIVDGTGFVDPQVAVRDNGEAYLVYSTSADGGGQIVGRTAGAGSAFGPAEPVYGAPARLRVLDLAIGGDGRTVLFDPTPVTFDDDLHALRFVAGAWNGPVRLDDSAPLTWTSRVVADDAGAARAFWYDSERGIHHRYVAAGSAAWGPTETIPLFEVPGSLQLDSRATMNIAGNALGVREVDDKVYAAQYRAGTGWSPPHVIYGDQRGYLTGLNTELAASGAGVVQWEFAPWDGDSPDWSRYSIWANVLR